MDAVGDDKGLVLVVEDDPAIADIERLYLVRAGFTVHLESDGRAGLEQVRRLRPAAVILDVGLPGLDGIEVCRAMREAGDWTPVLFVTARDDEVDRVLGIELGADDYVTKPFSPRELVARVKGIVRRSSGLIGDTVLRVEDVTLDPATRLVARGGIRVDLTATEFDLLAQLMARPGRVYSREELLSLVWGIADYSASRTVDVHVAQLRAKLGEGNPIRTVRGVGYSVAGREG
ncbi:response regulator transcription factor [Cryobacterium breve]|uniref:Response regulator transcription factor n=1 Tax=Cryobacterium breve TaxID=1259258 RepID=A0ABY7NA18_9MICO|nr:MULTISPECIES: response regulator transcription factor [Cryobacterium]MEA9998197.1 response regulator transcription factor [Cryobacterium sp. RTS3]MEB0266326.1 response regulator transcription factor [Cryobacterium sp. 10I5]WBM79352.1 response regulator transcription factor [Cryobacterium breve]